MYVSTKMASVCSLNLLRTYSHMCAGMYVHVHVHIAYVSYVDIQFLSSSPPMDIQIKPDGSNYSKVIGCIIVTQPQRTQYPLIQEYILNYRCLNLRI